MFIPGHIFVSILLRVFRIRNILIRLRVLSGPYRPGPVSDPSLYQSQFKIYDTSLNPYVIFIYMYLYINV
jgi:hypothetical protein